MDGNILERIVHRMDKLSEKFSTSLFLLAGLVLFYSLWMTGCTLKFEEVKVFPTYGMLAEAFANGRLDVAENVPVDVSHVNGKRYFYFGPVPALMRVPFLMLTGVSIPTGLMVVLYLSGIGTLFALLMVEMRASSESKLTGPATIVFAFTFFLCGNLLFIAMVPSIHHEAICAEIFFLMTAVYLILKLVRRNFSATFGQAAIIGISLSLAFGSRMIALPAAIFLIAVSVVGMHVYRSDTGLIRRSSSGAVVGIPVLSLLALSFYNFARFGSFFEMGHKYQTSIYSDYVLKGNALRYDNIPYNIWDYFFRLPTVRPGSWGVDFQPFIWEVHSKFGPKYYLIHFNELVVSIFWLMPILLFALAPLSNRLTGGNSVQNTNYRILMGVFALQTMWLFLFFGSCARYVLDFLPFLTAMAYVGVISFRFTDRAVLFLIVFLGALSVVLSINLPANAFSYYLPFIYYSSPWIR